MMGRPADDRFSPDTAREICERTGSAAFVDRLDCAPGQSVRDWPTGGELSTRATCSRKHRQQAAGKEAVLKALDNAAIRLRDKLGESLSSVQRYATPLQEATTPSLEALKAYSLASRDVL